MARSLLLPDGAVPAPAAVSGSSLEAQLELVVRRAVRHELHHLFDTQLRPLLAAREALPPTGRGPQELLTSEQAAAHAGVTTATIREWVRSGRLRGHRAGRLLRVRATDLDEFLASGAKSNVVDLDAEARRILAGARRR